MCNTDSPQQYRLYEQFFLSTVMLYVLTLGFIFIEEIEPCHFEIPDFWTGHRRFQFAARVYALASLGDFFCWTILSLRTGSLAWRGTRRGTRRRGWEREGKESLHASYCSSSILRPKSGRKIPIGWFSDYVNHPSRNQYGGNRHFNGRFETVVD